MRLNSLLYQINEKLRFREAEGGAESPFYNSIYQWGLLPLWPLYFLLTLTGGFIKE